MIYKGKEIHAVVSATEQWEIDDSGKPTVFAFDYEGVNVEYYIITEDKYIGIEFATVEQAKEAIDQAEKAQQILKASK